ncbi:MAG: hypothetical protein ACM3S1_05980 [Hyphomicrobiales bacterium]
MAVSVAVNGGDDEARQQNLDAIRENEARLLTSQKDVLDAYNSGKLDYRTLPLQELDADIGQVQDIRFPVTTASLVAIVRVDAVSFQSSGMGDLPAVHTTYTVERVMKGDVDQGSTIQTTVAGGPYRTSEGNTVYVVLPRGRMDVPGDRLVVFFDRFENGEYGNTDVTARFLVGADGKIVADENANMLHIAGVDAETYADSLERLASQPLQPGQPARSTP